MHQYIHQRHIRHAADPASDNGFSAQILPREIIRILSCDKERTVALCELTDDNRMLTCSFVDDIHAGFGSHKRELSVACNQCGHTLVTSASGNNLKLDPLGFKEAETYSGIERCIENGAGDLV